MRRYAGIIMIAVFSLFLLSCATVYAESLTITTYYPSPYGSYNELSVTNSMTIGSSGTAFTGLLHGAVAVNPPSIAAAASTTLTVTVTGAATTDRIFLTPPSAIEADLFYQGATITSANTVTIRIGNEGTGAVDGASRNWTYLLIKS
ncbi:MAG: hypothetical protein WC301_03550 [Candidatus Omnitrophota bacterium]|jgi:hypothetical protein